MSTEVKIIPTRPLPTWAEIHRWIDVRCARLRLWRGRLLDGSERLELDELYTLELRGFPDRATIYVCPNATDLAPWDLNGTEAPVTLDLAALSESWRREGYSLNLDFRGEFSAERGLATYVAAAFADAVAGYILIESAFVLGYPAGLFTSAQFREAYERDPLPEVSGRTTTPTTALLAPVPVEALDALRREDRFFSSYRLVEGAGAYHALADDEDGTAHELEEQEVEAALRLSRDCQGPVYVISYDMDTARITECRRGEVAVDHWDSENDREMPGPKWLTRSLGLGEMLPPDEPGVPSFMFVEHTTAEAVEGAIGTSVKSDGEVLWLEPRGENVLGWLGRATLGIYPSIVSRRLRARVFHTLHRAESLVVFVTENGVDVGLFETPRTSFSARSNREHLDSILGETTREGIMRVMGIPKDLVGE